MYNKGKYVVGDVRSDSSMLQPIAAICIPECVSHSDLQALFVPESITSAGFFNVDPKTGHIHAYGHSAGLGVKSEPRDIIFLARTLALVDENRVQIEEAKKHGHSQETPQEV